MSIHLCDGEVRTACPECDHWQPIKKPSGKIHCAKCRLLIDYKTGYSDNQFFRFRQQAMQNFSMYRKVG